MTFDPLKIDEFLANFDSNKTKIRSFEGCRHLELFQDQNKTNIFFTYSYWNSEVALNNYRHSELFKSVWAKTKPLFIERPEAWSVGKLRVLD